MAKEINISLCMIARDNERTIGPALESVMPWVDETIVADTGSLDSTPKVAESLGARVFHTIWSDDFSAARNFSIEQARGKWVFWMDTDDTLPEACGRKLQQLGRQSHPSNTMGFVMQVRCPTHGSNGIDEFTVVDHVKMFRNLPHLRFEGPIHEQILMPIRRLGGDIQWTDIYVVHSGADLSPESQRRKIDRDLRILQKDLVRRPNHPFVLFNLAMTYAESGQHAEALFWTKRCLAASEPSESHVRKAYAYLANCHFQLGNHNGALEACREGKRLFPSDPELLFREAMVLHESGRLGESISRYLEILDLENEDVFRSTDPGIKGFKCRFNLGIALRDANRPAEAECHWRSVLREVPSYVPACRALGEILLQQNRVTTAEIEAERMIASGKSKLEGLLLLAKVYEHRKNSRLTEHTLRECARLYPECEYVFEEYVRFCVRHGRLATAKDLLERFVTKFPQNAAAHHNLAAVDYQLGDLPRAIVSLRESLHLRPESSGTLAFYESAAAEHHVRTRTSSIPAENRTRISVCYRGEAITVIEAARILSLYTARGFQVEVACNQVQELFFRAIGATIVPSSSERWEPKRSPYDPLIHQVPDWRMSNAGWNIGEAPLPLLCHAAELWHEFSTKRIELLEQVPKSISMVVAKWLENAKRPIVVWQVNNQFSELISSHCGVSNGRSLISCLDDATVVVPSSSENVGRQIDVKFKYLSDLNIPDSPDLKITLLSQAKLVITDNRDLLQLAAACEVPAIGLWSGTDHPAKSAIPTPRQLNLRFGHTSSPNEHRWRIPWCLIQHEFGDAIADTVAKYTHAMLGEPRYLGPRSIAADVQLQHWISDLCHEGVQPVRDRGNSFSVLFQEIGRRFKNPTIVETGTIRALDDWAGAGYFTFLAGAYVYRAGGMLHSVDISGANCEFARQQCMPFCDQVQIHCNDSVAFLSSFPAKIDVLYCDSLDTYEPGFAEHAMREVQAAYHCLHEQAIIVFDDSPTDEGKLTGKGALAIPWLIEQGWRFLFSGYQQILVKID